MILVGIAAMSLQVQTPTAKPTYREVCSELQEARLKYSPTSPSSTFGTISKAGASAEIFVNVDAPRNEDHTNSPVSGITLVSEIGLPKEMKQAEVEAWQKRHPEVRSRFEAHLGKTVSTMASFGYSPTLDSKQLASAVEAYLGDVHRFMASSKGRPVRSNQTDWTKIHFDDDQTIDYPDQTSMSRVVQSWGWQYKGSFGGSSPDWIWPVQIGDQYLVVRGDTPDRAERRQELRLQADVQAPDDATIDQWIRELSPRAKWAEFVHGGATRLSICKTIPIGDGLRLADLRAKILEFATHVSDVKKEQPILQVPTAL